MKHFFLFVAAVFTTLLTVFGQVKLDFENISSLNVLTDKCWQFYGTALTSSRNATNKCLSLNPPSADGASWIQTAYIELTSASAISFTYQLAGRLSNGASRRLYVRLLGIDGTYTPVGAITLDHQSNTTPFTFSATSPISGVQRLVIEVTSSGNPSTALYLDELIIGGTFEYNLPYGCKANEDGVASIHYLKSFRGQLSGDKAQLEWTVAENENNSYFEVEKSSDGKEFKSIAHIKSTAKVAEEVYSYSDPLQPHAYYRLKLVSKNNIRMHSNVVFLKSNLATANSLTLLQNPVQHSLKFSFVSDTKSASVLTVYNLSGSKIFQTNFQTVKGYNVITTPFGPQLKTGMYLLEVVYANHRSTAKFSKE